MIPEALKKKQKNLSLHLENFDKIWDSITAFFGKISGES